MKDNKLKIAVILGSIIKEGGVTTFIEELTNVLIKRGYNVSIITFTKQPKASQLILNSISENVKVFDEILRRCQSVRIDGQTVQISGDDTRTVEVDCSCPFSTQQIGRKSDSSLIQIGQRSQLEPENVIVCGAIEN